LTGTQTGILQKSKHILQIGGSRQKLL